MSAAIWAAAGVVMSSFLTYLGVRFSSRTTAQTTKDTVASEAYTKALAIWETSVAQLTKDVQRLSTDLETARHDLDCARTEIRALVDNREQWERRERALEARVRRLEQELLDRGITPPPWEPPQTGL